jgi:HAD superfamily hydrolase (TIGR01509 family)
MSRYRAVLFDWMLTLAHYPTDRGLLCSVIGDVCDEEQIDRYLASLLENDAEQDLRALFAVEDTSQSAHRLANITRFRGAGIPDDHVEQLYGELGAIGQHPLYDDTACTLAAITAAGTHVAVVSDIHVDLRAHARAYGIEDHIDVWVLSYEIGVQKPDPAMFTTALERLGVAAADALMVGDCASRDGGAASVGIDTLTP